MLARLHDELSRWTYSLHGLLAVIRPDSGAGVPVVDGAVVLDAGIGAGPGRLGHLAEQVPGVHRLDGLPGQPGRQVELGVPLDRPHELVGDPDRVVGVLVLDARDVLAAQVHVEPGVAEDPDLLFLARLGLDEFLHVGVIDVEDDHLRGPAGGPAGLDGAGGRVRAAHEGDGPAGRAAGGEQFLGGPDPGQVDPGPGAALEDQAFFLVPVQDRVHRVVHREDETRAHLLRRAGPDVEPDRRVEGEDLVDERVGELVIEDLGVLGTGEVPVLTPGRHVLSDHAVDQLLETPLPLRGADRAAEVLGGDDVGGVDGPEVGEFDTTLLEVDGAVPPVGHDDIAALPGDLVVRVHALPGVNPPDREPLARALASARRRPAHRLRHVHPPSGIPADPTRARPGPSVDVIVRTRTPNSEPNMLLRKGASARPHPAAPCAARKSHPRNQ